MTSGKINPSTGKVAEFLHGHNGRTLCFDCHKKTKTYSKSFFKLYGYKQSAKTATIGGDSRV